MGSFLGSFLGSLLSILGGLGATLTGHWIGTKGEAAGKRWMGEMALDRARTFFQKHGLIALIVSRPIPILAEAISIIAGISGMPRKQLIPGTILGLIPAAVLYAIAGAYAVDLNSGLYAFLAVMLLATTVWAIGRLILHSKRRTSSVSN